MRSDLKKNSVPYVANIYIYILKQMEKSIAKKDYVANILVFTFFLKISNIFKEKIAKSAQILHCFSLV
jgi:hypothetical protein